MDNRATSECIDICLKEINLNSISESSRHPGCLTKSMHERDENRKKHCAVRDVETEHLLKTKAWMTTRCIVVSKCKKNSMTRNTKIQLTPVQGEVIPVISSVHTSINNFDISSSSSIFTSSINLCHCLDRHVTIVF